MPLCPRFPARSASLPLRMFVPSVSSSTANARRCVPLKVSSCTMTKQRRRERGFKASDLPLQRSGTDGRFN
ncbi:hypothetical protein BJ508DRAFT_152877 [Ascobolus immersus RN42]|uniref:Uncharacterized protein n=1 Tax=Ascobolus immersus RN42 TaxID=1160509 RepID=A0A3N4I3Q0_ASCIM|nr:hypothetical protein BJ508DRAFT_152877 [Ascobolus immersus RN42]